MYARILIAVVLVAGALAWSGAAPTYAQERDGCYDTRFGRMGCTTDIRQTNFSDPALEERGWYLLSNNRALANADVIVITYSNMEDEVIVTPRASSGSSRSASRTPPYQMRGEYQGSNAREWLCIVYSRSC
jgi:hypothetical protein